MLPPAMPHHAAIVISTLLMLPLLSACGDGYRNPAHVDPATLPRHLVLHEQPGAVEIGEWDFVGFLPNGSAFWTFSQGIGEVVIHDPATGAVRTVLNRQAEPVHGQLPVFSADGRRCVTRTDGKHGTKVVVWDVATGAAICTDPVDPQVNFAFALSSTGDHLLAGGDDGRATLVDLAHPGHPLVVDAAPDGFRDDGKPGHAAGLMEDVDVAFDADAARFVTVWNGMGRDRWQVGHFATWDAATGHRLLSKRADRILGRAHDEMRIQTDPVSTHPWLLSCNHVFVDPVTLTVVATQSYGRYALVAPDLLFVIREQPGPEVTPQDYMRAAIPISLLVGQSFPGGKPRMAVTLPSDMAVMAIAPDGGTILTRTGIPQFNKTGEYYEGLEPMGPLYIWKVERSP